MVNLTIPIGCFDSCSSEVSQFAIQYLTRPSPLACVNLDDSDRADGKHVDCIYGFPNIYLRFQRVLQAVERNGNGKVSKTRVRSRGRTRTDLGVGRAAWHHTGPRRARRARRLVGLAAGRSVLRDGVSGRSCGADKAGSRITCSRGARPRRVGDPDRGSHGRNPRHGAHLARRARATRAFVDPAACCC